MQQPCSNAIRTDRKLDDEQHRKEIRRLVAEAPDEPTYCEFKQTLLHATPKERGELVKDVSSFANADLEALGGYGYIIFGVSNGGQVVGIVDVAGDPSSAARQVINGHLGRSVGFEYLTCEVDDKAGGTKRVAAIVVPDSRRRPHVVAREIRERLGNRDKFWLRKGEVWVRKTGGRELATADDMDEMYEGKLRRLVEERVRPLQERIQVLERDLREQRRTVPDLGFGFIASDSFEPLPEGKPRSVLNNLIDVERIAEEMAWAEERTEAVAGHRRYIATGPFQEDYAQYRQELEAWVSQLADILVVDFVLTNTGRAPAEDVQAALLVPAELRPREGLPEEPERPRSPLEPAPFAGGIPALVSKQNSPDSLIGPELYAVGNEADETDAMWEVGRLYHDRPLFTDSDREEVSGLFISRSGYEELARRSPEGIRLRYAVRAANVPETLRGCLVLRGVPC